MLYYYSYFRGAYLVYTEEDDDDIDFMIYDPNGELIWLII